MRGDHHPTTRASSLLMTAALLAACEQAVSPAGVVKLEFDKLRTACRG